jgi:putative mRNA 3-end processing factor
LVDGEQAAKNKEATRKGLIARQHMLKTRRMRAASADDPAFVWADGPRVAGTQIWCDAPRSPMAGAVCFVSHAHHRVSWPGSGQARLLVHPRTLALAAAAGAPASDALPSAFGRPFAIGRLRLELLPSGHVPGAAQLLVDRPEGRVLYAGDINPTPTRTAEPLQVRAADAVCLEATLAPLTVGRPLPPRAEVERALVDAVRVALDEKKVPVVLAPALGGAGEVAALLLGAGIAVRAHRRIAAYLSAYDRLGIALGGAVSRLRGWVEDVAVLWPLDAQHPPPIDPGRARRLLVSGHAIDPAFTALHRADAAFALSDHGDLASLVTFASDVGARDVWLTAGLTDEVASAFSARKLRVHALARPSQMPLAGV